MNEQLLTPLFTVEEENLICVFDTSSRIALTDNISAAIPDFDEPEMFEIAESTLRKLNTMTDAEFTEYTFHPAYHEEDDDFDDDVDTDTVLIEVITKENLGEE